MIVRSIISKFISRFAFIY